MKIRTRSRSCPWLALLGALLFPAQGVRADTIPDLVDALASGDAMARASAVERLATVGVQAVAPVSRLLGAPDPAVARAARDAMAGIAHRASRAGAETERAAVASAVAAACAGAKTPGARTALLEVLGLIGKAESVGAAVAALGNPETHGAACAALARNPSAEAARALREALSRDDREEPLLRMALVNAVGHKEDYEAGQLLADLAEGADDPGLRLAALEALARNPMAYAYRHVFWGALPAADDADHRRLRARVWACLLRVGVAFLDAAERGAASDLYCELFENAGSSEERCSALVGMARSSRRRAPGLVLEALDDENPQVRATARSLLAGLRGVGVWPGIAERLKRAPAAEKILLLRALVGDRDVPAVELFASHLDHENAGVRAAALAALAANATREALTALLGAVSANGPIVEEGLIGVISRWRGEGATDAIVTAARQGAQESRVRLLLALARRQDPAARALFLESSRSPLAQERLAAYRGLAKLGSADDVSILLESLDRGGPAAEAAGRALELVRSPGGMKALLHAARERRGATPAPILRALGRHRDEGVVDVLLEAVGERDAATRRAALGGLCAQEDRRALPVVLDILSHGPDDLRHEAALAALRFGRTVEVSSPEVALSAYHRILQAPGGGSEDFRREAIAGLARLARAESIAVLEPLLDGKTLRREVAAALLAIVVELDPPRPEEAARIVRKALPLAPGSAAAAPAVEMMRPSGADLGLARSAGFVTRWWLLGPFANPLNRRFEEDFLDADRLRIDVPQTICVDGSTLSWQRHDTTDPRGIVDLGRALAQRENVGAYAQAVVETAELRRAVLRLGSDDSIVCWLDGKKIHAFDGARAIAIDEESVPVKLEPGRHRILLKILNRGGGWGFCLRITDRDGNPLVLEVAGKNG